MVNKSVQESTGESQKKKIFSNSKSVGKSEDNCDSNRLHLAGDKNEASKHPVIYYRGENMKKDITKRLSLRTTDRKAPKDTSYHETPHDHIDYRYECIRSLGKGSFGNVILAIDHKENTECAVKVVRRDIRFTTQAKEEIAILELLQRMNPHPHGSSDHFPIVKLIEHFMFREHMCLSFELLGCSLYDLIKDRKDQGLPRDRVRRLMSSVLDGLCYVRNAGIIHCDLKPENVLLVSRATDGGPDDIRDLVKIIDFGSSCFIGKQCYPYIQSRFYRAPEVILRLDYSQPIDIWSFGCLVFEMIRGYPLFPGEDEFDQLACMMEKLSMPPWSMVSSSRVFSRYFSEPESTRKYFNPLDKQTPLQFIPRYCTIHQNPDGSAELRPNLSKKTRRLRKPPGAVPLMQALVSTLSHSSGKYNDYTPTPSEEIDNTHVVKLIEACLNWTPDKRITPDQARNFSWFSYKTYNNSGIHPIALLSRSSRSPNLSAASSKLSSTSSQLSLHTETIPNFKYTAINTTTFPVVPLPATMVASAAPEPIMVPPSPPSLIVSRTAARPRMSNAVTTVRLSEASVSPPSSENSRRRGSSASISSGENKQEERIIYARVYKAHSPKPSFFEYNNGNRNSQGNLEKKISDISLASRGSSIDDLVPRTLDTSRYARKNGAPTNERFLEPSMRLRKRNQSTEPKRHTQPVGNEAGPKERHVVPSQNLVTSRTAAMSSSPEDESQRSGRCNPNTFNKNSQWDLSAVGRRDFKATNVDARSNAAKARQHITIRSELLTLDRRPPMTKTRSLADFPENNSINNSDDSESSNRRQIYENAPRIISQRKPTKRVLLTEPMYADPVIKVMPQQSKELPSSKMTTSRVYGVRDSGGKVLQPHTDYRRRRMPNKSASIGQLGGLPDTKLTNSQSTEISTNPRVHNTRLNAPIESENGSFMDLNKVQPSIMMIKP